MLQLSSIRLHSISIKRYQHILTKKYVHKYSATLSFYQGNSIRNYFLTLKLLAIIFDKKIDCFYTKIMAQKYDIIDIDFIYLAAIISKFYYTVNKPKIQPTKIQKYVVTGVHLK